QASPKKNLNSDDHFDRAFSFVAMKGKLRNQNKRRKENNESTDSVQKNTNSSTSYRIGVCCRARRAGSAAAREHGPAVEQDRRGYSRGVGRVPRGGLHLHGLRLRCGVRRSGRDRGRLGAVWSRDHGPSGGVDRRGGRRGGLPDARLLL